MKISQTDRRRHLSAEEILKQDKAITWDERVEVLSTWHEGFNQDQAGMSAFFTPLELSYHLALEVPNKAKVLDLCAGIGALSHAISTDIQMPAELVLVEQNAEYCRVARKLFPEAEVICGSMYDRGLMFELSLRGFDVVISNPPFGRISKQAGDNGVRFSGEAHFEAIDIASDLAPWGVFILPQMACPFAYSGRHSYEQKENARYDAFANATGIVLEIASSSVDTSNLGEFRNTKITTEIVTADFSNARRRRKPAQADIFAAAA